MVLEYQCLKCNRVQSSFGKLSHCLFCKNPLSHPKEISGEHHDAPKSRGLGDTVAKVIKAATLGIVKPCGGCEERRKKLNELFPYEGEK